MSQLMHRNHEKRISTARVKTNTDNFNASRHLEKHRIDHLSHNKAVGLQFTLASKRCATVKDQLHAAIRKNSLRQCHYVSRRTIQGPDALNEGLENWGRAALCVLHRAYSTA